MRERFQSVKSAKDFLVDQIKLQASLEQVSLTESEIRELYYSVDDPEPETDVDIDPSFEDKIAGLLNRRYKALENENTIRAKFLTAATKLKTGDHYLSVMVAAALENRSPQVTKINLKQAILIVVGLAVLMIVGAKIVSMVLN